MNKISRFFQVIFLIPLSFSPAALAQELPLNDIIEGLSIFETDRAMPQNIERIRLVHSFGTASRFEVEIQGSSMSPNQGRIAIDARIIPPMGTQWSDLKTTQGNPINIHHSDVSTVAFTKMLRRLQETFQVIDARPFFVKKILIQTRTNLLSPIITLEIVGRAFPDTDNKDSTEQNPQTRTATVQYDLDQDHFLMDTFLFLQPK